MFSTVNNSLSPQLHSLRTILITFVVLLLLAVSQNTVLAWNTITHAQLAQIAFNHLPESVQEALTPYTAHIYDGAVAPDLYIRDWPNHDLNVHGAEKEKQFAISRITELYESINNKLADPDTALSSIAYDMGLLSHYLADLNQPLHTDQLAQEDLLHNTYESDVFHWQDQFVFTDKGHRFNVAPEKVAQESAERANRFYYPVYLSYLDYGSFDNSMGITWISLQNTIDDIRDTWLTLWLRYRSPKTNLAFWSSKKAYQPGESIKILLSVLQSHNQATEKSDLYLAATAPSGDLWFINEKSEFVQDSVPRYKKWFNTDSQIEIADSLVWPESQTGHYKLHALLVKQGSDLTNPDNWLSNIVSHQFDVKKLQNIRLNELNNELYLFPAIAPDSEQITTIPLQRWDFIFLGEVTTSAYEESSVNEFIPGQYDHIMVYLGRDDRGTPYAMEMTYSLENAIVELHLLRLPEFLKAMPGSDTLSLPVVTKPIWKYKNRWAKRLVLTELEKIVKNEKALLHQIETHWRNRFPYQLEFLWSGDFNDKQVKLVDDGYLNGASCTDYWLILFETTAGVCIHDARIDAHDLTDYYTNDPIVAQSPIPDALNPFSFEITSSDLINTFKFELIDPPAHTFSCDATTETGVAIPGRLINSPQFKEITPALEISNWP